MQPSIAHITSVDVQTKRVVATLKPTEQETGWLSCLTEVTEDLAGKEAVVIPCSGSLANALVIPFPLPLPLIGTVLAGGVEVNGHPVPIARSVPVLAALEPGRDVLLVPTAGGLVVAGVLQS